jgi:SAM-dependent methyltransferase
MSQSEVELGFWEQELAKGAEGFLEQRQDDWQTHLKHFPELSDKKTKILEVGTGLISVFEFSDKKCVSIDPLQSHFQGMMRKPDAKVDYRRDWEGIKPHSFKEILCVNVIDHTPDPRFLMDKIKTALKPKGKLYFEVNFDDALSPAHYGLWDKAKVDDLMKDWTLVRDEIEPNLGYGQLKYWAVYTI